MRPGCGYFQPPLSEKRARGTPDARCVRSPVCKVVESTRVSSPRKHRIVRRSARDGLSACFALSPATVVTCSPSSPPVPDAARIWTHRQQTGFRSGPHDLGRRARKRPSRWGGMRIGTWSYRNIVKAQIAVTALAGSARGGRGGGGHKRRRFGNQRAAGDRVCAPHPTGLLHVSPCHPPKGPPRGRVTLEPREWSYVGRVTRCALSAKSAGFRPAHQDRSAAGWRNWPRNPITTRRTHQKTIGLTRERIFGISIADNSIFKICMKPCASAVDQSIATYYRPLNDPLLFRSVI